MSCPKNPKVFWIFKYDGACLYKDTYVKAAMTTGNFHVTQRCELCESTRELHFISQQSMIRAGYDTHKLGKLSGFDLGVSPEQLK